jgi:hypothetical protein
MAYSDLKVSLAGTNGTAVTISVYNPEGNDETARVQVVVQLAAGGQETLTSLPFTIAAGATRSLTLIASGPIGSISDGPDPIAP